MVVEEWDRRVARPSTRYRGVNAEHAHGRGLPRCLRPTPAPDPVWRERALRIAEPGRAAGRQRAVRLADRPSTSTPAGRRCRSTTGTGRPTRSARTGRPIGHRIGVVAARAWTCGPPLGRAATDDWPAAGRGVRLFDRAVELTAGRSTARTGSSTRSTAPAARWCRQRMHWVARRGAGRGGRPAPGHRRRTRYAAACDRWLGLRRPAAWSTRRAAPGGTSSTRPTARPRPSGPASRTRTTLSRPCSCPACRSPRPSSPPSPAVCSTVPVELVSRARGSFVVETRAPTPEVADAVRPDDLRRPWPAGGDA